MKMISLVLKFCQKPRIKGGIRIINRRTKYEYSSIQSNCFIKLSQAKVKVSIFVKLSY